MRGTVLLVDDDEDIIDSLKILFDSEGFTSFVAKNGKEAVEQYNSIKPDIIVLDLMMPQYDGFYTLEEIRKTGKIDTKIFVITGVISEEYKKRLENHNVIVLYKPINIKLLIDKIIRLN